jgi:hypothetical protein
MNAIQKNINRAIEEAQTIRDELALQQTWGQQMQEMSFQNSMIDMIFLKHKVKRSLMWSMIQQMN